MRRNSQEPKQVCSYCGRDNAMTEKHCRECGTELVQIAVSDALPTVPVLEFPKQNASPLPPVLMIARRTSGHPVADNPIRMLATDDWKTPRDLVRNARRLALMARDREIESPEPGNTLCPRIRSREDYLAAEKKISDPITLAVGLVFLPDHWIRPSTSIGRANLLLLEAEQFAQGDGRKADLVNRAIRCWDSEEGTRAIDSACRAAEGFLGTPVDAAAVQREVAQALASIAEHIIADFGESIELPELELLNTLDSCQRLPEVRGATAAGDTILRKQCERIQHYFTLGSELGSSGRLKTGNRISESELARLIATARDAKASLALLQHRPALLHRLGEVPHQQLCTLSTSLAFELGWNQNQWIAAAELVRGLRPEDVAPHLPDHSKRMLQVSIRSIPLVADAARGENRLHEIEALHMAFPDFPREVNLFRARAQEILSTIPGTGVSRPRTPDNDESGGKVGWVAAIVITIFLLRACNSGGRHSTYPTYPKNGSRQFQLPEVPLRFENHTPSRVRLNPGTWRYRSDA
jgi:hypothetical protein